MTLFDAYLMVDWSANSAPKSGPDSIWAGLIERQPRGLARTALVNLPTRRLAAQWLTATLDGLAAAGRRTLVGFDFPLGYPTGFAARLHLGGTPWLATWTEIDRLIKDGDDNANNRFAVASSFNRRISGRRFPFWGHHPAHRIAGLGPRRPEGYCLGRLEERRRVEHRVRGPQPSWKLYGTGSVGSQALVGIPVVAGLRRRFVDRARVWPFETGLRPPANGAAIVLAEIYPSLVDDRRNRHAVKDARQVTAIGSHFARADDDGSLAVLFAPPDLTASERRIVEREEGWILGVG